MTKTVIGIFDNAEAARHAVEKLGNRGFTIDDVDLTVNSRSSLENYSDQTGSTTSLTSSTTASSSNDNDSFGEKISNFFKSLFDDDDEREKYTSVGRNSSIVTVIADSDERAELAAEILDDAGAVDVDERARDYSGQMSGAGAYDQSRTSGITSDSSIDTATSTYDTDRDTSFRSDVVSDDNITDRSIPIVEENLHVGKREVERGSVRLRSRIIERPVEESVRLREERVSIDRNPVNRPATEGDLSTFREGEVELKQRAEVPVVSKEARVVEEIRINKDVTEREEVIRDTVRKTEVDIDETDTDTNTSTRSGRGKGTV